MERKKRVIFIGSSTAGKTTLCQRINGETLQYQKTQTVQIVNQTMIDTPGEYFQRQYFRGALQVTAVDADVIALVQDPTEHGTMFPPMYSTMFNKPAVGIVTKLDLATPEQVETAKAYLEAAGAGKLFLVSSVTGEGVAALTTFFESL